MKAWEEFEKFIKEIAEHHGFHTEHRVIFKDDHGRSEIDILAGRFDLILAIDAKRYTKSWYRTSAIKREAKKHSERCKRFEKIIGKSVIPVIVSLIDDRIFKYGGCLIIPVDKFNDFLNNIYLYLEEFA
uniref:Restriction endonuclease type IV Mrr domain-containing protein n=1 Tax=Geoglobus ahangari TaxID=113653 RepID=A0A7C4S743_9EURY